MKVVNVGGIGTVANSQHFLHGRRTASNDTPNDTELSTARYPDFCFLLLVAGGFAGCRGLLTAGAAADAEHAVS